MKHFQIDRSQWLFSLRATVASLWALWIGFRLGLESPHWAAITVWVVTQPSRGKTFSKGLYRFLGTCLGALFAIFLIQFFDQDPWIFLILLSVWVGLSTATANLVQYFRSYGSMLAGFTAALVSLSAFSHPDQVMKVAEARILSIFLGIAVTVFMASFLSQSSSKKELSENLNQVILQTFQWVLDIFRRRSRSELVEDERKLVAQVTTIDELVTYAATESMQVRKQKNHLHSLIAQLFATISAARAVSLQFRKYPELVESTSQFRKSSEEIFSRHSQQLQSTSQWPEDLSKIDLNLNSFFELSDPKSERKVLIDRLHHFQNTFNELLDQYASLNRQTLKGAPHPLAFHRDKRHALTVGIRSTLAVFAVAAIWQLTQWPLGPLMVIMTAVNCGVFATSSNPKSGLLVAFRASILSLLASLACLGILSAGPHNLFFLFFILALFLIPAGLLVPHPTKSLAGTLFCANFLVFVAPAYPIPEFHFSSFLNLAVGFFAAILLTFLFFSFILPTDPVKRSRNMVRDLIRDMERMARASTDYRAFEWETLMYNRVSGLIKVLAEAGDIQQSLMEGCFAVLDVGQEIIRLRGTLRNASLPQEQRTVIAKALNELSEVSQDPQRVIENLNSLSLSHCHLPAHLRNGLSDVSDRLRTHQEFFAQASMTSKGLTFQSK